MKIDITEMTPVEHRGDFFFKRDDLFSVCGVYGGKSRAAFQIITDAINKLWEIYNENRHSNS